MNGFGSLPNDYVVTVSTRLSINGPYVRAIIFDRARNNGCVRARRWFSF